MQGTDNASGMLRKSDLLGIAMAQIFGGEHANQVGANCRQRRRRVVCADQGLIPHQGGSGSELFDSSRIGSCSICDASISKYGKHF